MHWAAAVHDLLIQMALGSRANDGRREQPAPAQFHGESLSQVRTLQERSEPPEPTEKRQANGEQRQTSEDDREHQRCDKYGEYSERAQANLFATESMQSANNPERLVTAPKD